MIRHTLLTIASIAFVAAAVLGQSRSGATSQRIPQFENDSVKVWKSVIVPHSPSDVHRHDHGRTIVALVSGDLTIAQTSGEKRVMHWDAGKAYWLPADPPGEMHRDVNETGSIIEVVVVEMK